MEIKTSKRISRIDSSEIRKIFDLVGKLKNPKNLSIGQPDFPVPQVVKDAMVKAVLDNKNSYTPTQGIVNLREKLSQQWKEKGIDIHPDDILVSAGVASILYLLFDVLLDAGDQILIVEPYFLIYDSLAQYHDLKRHYLPENFGEKDIEKLIQDKTFNPRVIIFSSPSNPTGTMLNREQLQLLSNLAESKKSLIISDEIYCAFDYENRHVPMATVNPERTITLGGFSKSHAMTGLRVGYMGVHSSLSPVLQKVTALQQYSVVCSPAPAQWAAVTALENPLVDEFRIMKKRRDRVVELLQGKVAFPYPSGAFYVFPSIPIDSREFIRRAIEAELLVVPGYIFTHDSKTVRISYAQNDAILEEGLKIFLDICEAAKNE